MNKTQIGFGGGCHWCTEAVFQSLRGTQRVEQGFIISTPPHDTYSEAVIVTFDPTIIPLDILIEVHLRTHASTSAHKMRGKYRSAIYTFTDDQALLVDGKLAAMASDFDKPIVTMTLPYKGFKPSIEQFHDYYRTNEGRPFCKTYIDPKLSKIRQNFADYYSPISS